MTYQQTRKRWNSTLKNKDNKTEEQFKQQQQSSGSSETFNSNMDGSDQLPKHPNWFLQLPAVSGGQHHILSSIVSFCNVETQPWCWPTNKEKGRLRKESRHRNNRKRRIPDLDYNGLEAIVLEISKVETPDRILPFVTETSGPFFLKLWSVTFFSSEDYFSLPFELRRNCLELQKL